MSKATRLEIDGDELELAVGCSNVSKKRSRKSILRVELNGVGTEVMESSSERGVEVRPSSRRARALPWLPTVSRHDDLEIHVESVWIILHDQPCTLIRSTISPTFQQFEMAVRRAISRVPPFVSLWRVELPSDPHKRSRQLNRLSSHAWTFVSCLPTIHLPQAPTDRLASPPSLAPLQWSPAELLSKSREEPISIPTSSPLASSVLRFT